MFDGSCLLIVNRSFASLSMAAEVIVQRNFRTSATVWTTRGNEHDLTTVRSLVAREDFDYLLNFLSAVIMPIDVLNSIRIDCLNVHPAPPRWPGVGSVSLAMLAGEATFGVTVHRMTIPVDSGEIVYSLAFEVDEGDSADSIWDKALGFALIGFQDVVNLIIAAGGRLDPNGDSWDRQAVSREEFEKILELESLDLSPDIERRIRATDFEGKSPPYISVGDYRFVLESRPQSHLGR